MPFPNGNPYDTTPYNATVGIYWFDVMNKPHYACNTELLNDVTMLQAKRRGHKRATEFGLTPAGKWQHATANYATREYQTATDARRLVVVERSCS